MAHGVGGWISRMKRRWPTRAEIVILFVTGLAVASFARTETNQTRIERIEGDVRIIRQTREACRGPKSCQELLDRLLAFASSRQRDQIRRDVPALYRRLRRVEREQLANPTRPLLEPPPVVPPEPRPKVPLRRGPPGRIGPEGPQGRPGESKPVVPLPLQVCQILKNPAALPLLEPFDPVTQPLTGCS